MDHEWLVSEDKYALRNNLQQQKKKRKEKKRKRNEIY